MFPHLRTKSLMNQQTVRARGEMTMTREKLQNDTDEGLVEQLRGRTGGRVAAFSFERASAMAEQLEAAGQEPLEFSCTIMVLGKTGVGKSATINSIFDEGIKVRVIDTPGLLPFWADQRKNQKNLQSVKKFIQKSPPDIVLYLDRLDMQSRDDMPLLRTITDIFGQSIWFKCIVVLTHAASATA
ncbi:translocase of chloroplast 120, chloroplastic-like protein [Tanacetum coccineum]